MSSITAYTDESGNSGNNLFDSQQPWFWTGTLLSEADLQRLGTSDLADWTTTLRVEELHGNALGLPRMEQIADGLREFLGRHDCRLVFTRVEKRHLATTKLVDLLIDSGINDAVSPFHYGNRFFRLLLAYGIARRVSPSMQVEFWSMYCTGNRDGFLRVLRRLRWNVSNKETDRRMRELLLDAVSWAIEHPEPFLEYTRSDLDAPNMIAFALLLDGVHRRLDGTDLRVGRFIHDEQNQFAKAMRQMYGILKRVHLDTSPLAWMTNIKEIDTYECEVEMAPSSSSVGLQLIDLVLWLVKRRIEGTVPFPGSLRACNALIDSVAASGTLMTFSRAQLAADVRENFEYLAEQSIRPEDAAKAPGLVEKFEAWRKRRMETGDGGALD